MHGESLVGSTNGGGTNGGTQGEVLIVEVVGDTCVDLVAATCRH